MKTIRLNILHPFAFMLALLLALPLRAQIFTTATPDVGSGGDVGQHTSQAIVNGNPAISYYDVTSGDLKFVRATNSTARHGELP